MSIVDHLEQFLGPITVGWSKDADANQMHAQVVKFDEGPIDGVAVYSTLGLSHYKLALPGKEPIRIELLMMIRKGIFERFIPSLMQQLVEEMIHGGQAPLRGRSLAPEVRSTRTLALKPSSSITPSACLISSTPVRTPRVQSSLSG